MAFNPDDMSRFDNFNVLTTPFKTVHSHEITLNVLYPKSLTKSPAQGSPVLIRYHGGGLVAGSSMFPDFFGRWILELAERHSAIIVSPDYRLLPEANAMDILEDVEDAWKWIRSSLATYLGKETNGNIVPDNNRILTGGESAGGYLSLVLSLSYPDQIRATTAQYPMVHMKSPHFSEKYEKQLLDFPQMPASILDEHIAKTRQALSSSGEQRNVVVSSDPRLDRAPLFFISVQQGRYMDYFDANKTELYPLERLAAGERFPRGGVFVCHGSEDSVVPVEQSEMLAAKVKEVDPDLYFRLAKRPGDHGFDGETKIDEDWILEGLAPLLKAWLE